MQLIRFENVNLLNIVEAAAGAVIVLSIIKLLDEIFDSKPAFSFPTFVKLQPKKRKDFSESTKEKTKIRQGFLCNMCRKAPELWEFHHRNGDRSNNYPSNCEGLCPLCHAKKTRKKTLV